MTFKIDENVPLPPQNRGRKSKYPFYELEVGQSFFVPDEFKKKITGYIGYARKCLPKRKFTARSVEEGEDKGIRVWRIK